jgi:pyruvate dehydrogenase E1 component beta subunit
VPEELYEVPIGKAALRRSGSDVTLVAGSTTVPTSLAAAEALEKLGIDVELVDLRSIKPWDRDMVFSSVGKTGRLVIADAAWLTGSVAGEIAATVAEELFHALKAPILRVCLPDIPAPTSTALEATYYIRPESISAAVQKVLHYA